MDFDFITKIIDDIVAFIKSAVANLQKFIAGFSSGNAFVVPEDAE